ncbi:predicted permease [Lachnospiraceae bacterium KM106-2]|nr:predicted permease [Lachnospiraceae bacterium KM106-2]
MKKYFWISVFTIILFIPLFQQTATADTGPKPSVRVTFKGLEKEKYYVTLLSKQEGSGPWRMDKEYDGKNKEIWKKFESYKDHDSFHFIGCFSECSETHQFDWTYWPPDEFKILIYFPKQNQFLISTDSYTRYAFDSYYTVTVRNNKIRSITHPDQTLEVEKTYDSRSEIINLLARIILTIVMELVVAYLFYYRTKMQIAIIVVTNIMTQTILNILLNVINYNKGEYAFVFHYMWMEMVIILIEGAIYSQLLQRYEKNPTREGAPWSYAILANGLSFFLGIIIAYYIPGIF